MSGGLDENQLGDSEIVKEQLNNIKNDFSGLIDMVKKAMLGEEHKCIAVMNYGEWVYGEMMHGEIDKPIDLKAVNEESICQDLYDSLINEFGEQLRFGYSHGMFNDWEYFQTLGEKLMICYPNDDQFREWLYNQVHKDNESRRLKRK